MEALLTGKALWSHDYEVAERDTADDIVLHMMSLPFHRHSGAIVLTDESLAIAGEEELKIFLDEISQIYLGFDEIFPAAMVRSFGMFWQPLRITLKNRQSFYLIIDYNLLDTNNHHWFNALQQLLSE